MQIDPQYYLDLAEKTSDMVFFDIESSGGFNADYGSTLVVSVKPYGQKPYSFPIKQVGNDQKVVREAKECLESFGSWVSYYGKGFDVPFLNTRLLKWGLQPIETRPHIDMFFVLKHHTKMSRKGLASFASFLELEDLKMGVSQNVWSEAAWKASHMKTIVKRCEQDCITLEQLYNKTRHIIKDIKR